MSKTQRSEEFVPAWKSPWVWGIAAIMAATLTANFVMISIGLNTHPGLVVDDFYARGKNYFNTEAQRHEDINRLGWQMQLVTPAAFKLDEQKPYHFIVRDKDGYPVKGAAVEFSAFRPNDSKSDFSLGMMEVRDGEYVTEVAFTLPGNWDLIVTAKHGEDKMDIAQRIFIEK